MKSWRRCRVWYTESMGTPIQLPLIENSKPKPASHSVLKLVIRCIVICVIVLAVAALWYFLTITSRIPDYFRIKKGGRRYIKISCYCHQLDEQNPSEGVWATYTYDKEFYIYFDELINLHEHPPLKIEIEGDECRATGISGSCNPLTDKFVTP